MAVEQTTSKILVEIETFLFYRKSRVGIIAGKLLKPFFLVDANLLEKENLVISNLNWT